MTIHLLVSFGCALAIYLNGVYQYKKGQSQGISFTLERFAKAEPEATERFHKKVLQAANKGNTR
jgi:hypothetical protein